MHERTIKQEKRIPSNKLDFKALKVANRIFSSSGPSDHDPTSSGKKTNSRGARA
jgi:hypothetical protein